MSVINCKLKTIPSTVQRGRISKKQHQTLKLEFNNYCLPLNQISPINIFGNKNNLVVDIGFGNGDQLLTASQQNPHHNFIGIELYKKGIANLINKMKDNTNDSANIKIIYGDAKIVLKKFFSNCSIFKIQIFFPDPWPKLKHHKRRLINHDFIEMIKTKLLPEGILHVSTDSDDYANHIIKTIANSDQFYKLEQHNLLRPKTKFEQLGISLGNKIYDLVFINKYTLKQDIIK